MLRCLCVVICVHYGGLGHVGRFVVAFFRFSMLHAPHFYPVITFSTDQWCLGCDDDTKNLIGKAVIVHQGTDDLISQPSGAAGARISCVGIIE